MPKTPKSQPSYTAMRHLTTKQMRIFATVAKHASFIRASDELSLSPPAVTIQVKEMEETIGLPLFDRSGRTVTLTVTGEYLLVYVKKILGTMREIENFVAKVRKLELGRIKIGVVNTAKYFMPMLITAFKKSHPDVEVDFVVAQRQQLFYLLTEGDMDFAVMGRPPKELEMRVEPFASNPHGFLMSPNYLPERSIDPDAFMHLPLLIREEGSGTRALIDRFFGNLGITPKLSLQAPSNEVLKQAAMAQMGIAFLSLHTVRTEVPSGQLEILDVAGTPIYRSWHCVTSKGKNLSPLAEAFRYFLCERGQALMESFYQDLTPYLKTNIKVE